MPNSVDRRLARVEGQLGGVRRMVREGSYCIDVLTQISAVRSALNQVAAEIASEHVRRCVLRSDDPHPHSEAMTQDEMLTELRETLRRLMR